MMASEYHKDDKSSLLQCHSNRTEATEHWSFEQDVPLEIQILIFEKLYYLDPGSIIACMTLSRKTNCILNPIRYRKFILGQQLHRPQNEDPLMKAASNSVLAKIYTHTRNLQVIRGGAPEPIEEFLSQCQRLEDLNWVCSYTFLRSAIPPKILQLISSKFPQIRLHLKNYPFFSKSDGCTPKLAPNFPASNLYCISIGRDKKRSAFPYFGTRLLHQVIFDAVNLKKLSLEHINGFQEIPSPDRRIAPIRELTLGPCAWPLSGLDVSKVWDFSRLECLTLIRMPTFKFLSSIPSHSFPSLKKLEISTYRSDDPVSLAQQVDITMMLCRLIEGSPNLEKLDVCCIVTKLYLHSVAWPTNLRVFKLRDFMEMNDTCIQGPHSPWRSKLPQHHFPLPRSDGTLVPIIDMKELISIQHSCYWITSLRLELDIGSPEFKSYLDILTQFKHLHDLKIRTQSLIHRRHEPGLDDSIDLQASENAVIYLSDRMLDHYTLNVHFVIWQRRWINEDGDVNPPHANIYEWCELLRGRRILPLSEFAFRIAEGSTTLVENKKFETLGSYDRRTQLRRRERRQTLYNTPPKAPV